MENPSETDRIRLRVVLRPDARIEAVEAAITDLDGTVHEALPYSCLVISLPETSIEPLCQTGGISAIETEAVLSSTGDAGEDVSIDRD